MSFFSAFATDVAIDLGTANTCVFARGRGIVLNEPSIVAFNIAKGSIEAVGTEAHEMLGLSLIHISEPIRLIVQAVRDALERVPPELSADIFDRGVVLTGGGALLRNLDKRLRDETGLPVLVAENPLTSVVLGAGRMLTDLALLRKVALD